MVRGHALVLSLLLVWILSCQAQPRLHQVKGTVTFQGQPVPAGMIYFDPDITKQNSGSQGYAVINNGAYDTAAKGGVGVIGGPHIVRIQGFDGKSGNDLPMGRPLFTDFQQAVDLPRQDASHDFEVPAR